MTMMDSLIQDINKQFKGDWVRRARDVKRAPRVPTGIFSLDASLGGGVPLGHFTLISGRPSGGKSALSMRLAANCQRTDRDTLEPLVYDEQGVARRLDGQEGTPMRVAYFNSERTFDKDWASRLGVLLDEVFYAEVPQQEDCYDIMDATVRTGEFDLLILDSIATLVPKAEEEKSASDNVVGNAAKANARGLRVLSASMAQITAEKKAAPAIVMINQERKAIGQMFGDPTVLPGGEAQHFMASLWIDIRPTQPVRDGKVMVGRGSKWKLKKNKVTGPLDEGEFVTFVRDVGMFRKGETNAAEQILDMAIGLSMVEYRGGWVRFSDDNKHHGKEAAWGYLLANPEHLETLRQEVLDKLREAN